MIKKLKEFLKKKKQERLEKAKIKRTEEYYKTLKKGVAVLQYIYQDLEKGAKKMNRATRRRFKKNLKKDGRFTEEIIHHYEKHFDNILKEIKKKNV